MQLTIQLVPEHPAKSLPLAPVCVIATAYCPLVLMMQRSGPGDPERDLADLKYTLA